MCELFGMSSDRRATTRLSLMALAEHGGISGPHKDGWGVAYYEGADVRLIKDAEMAAGSDWIRFLEGHDLRSSMVIAHIRRATAGERSYRNTQPFARELAGRMHLFAHNGWLPDIDRLPEFRSRRFHAVGETDSEWAFCVLLDRLAEIWTQPNDIPSLDTRMAVVSSFAQSLRPLGPANFLYCDGDTLFAHGHRRKQAGSSKAAPPGLWLLQRWCHEGEHGFAADGVAVVGTGQRIALLASVPLSNEPWLALSEGEVVAVSSGQLVTRCPAGPDAPAPNASSGARS
jgi:predicted glutamine amidotransferase